ncbi:MAG: catalase [Lachnospiraceae bacterium]|nr:catalase [Lachnospiraceae bacterium]
MSKFWSHFTTITKHRWLVRKGCFKAGLYWQGLVHDLSKYSPTEFWVGVKYFQGDRSPNNAEREDKGYSSAWLHHKGRNKHHYEYWIDYNSHGNKSGESIMVPVPMPDKYIAEMIMDRIAASKVYRGKDYTDADPLNYYWQGTQNAPLHDYTRTTLLKYLEMLAEKGEDETFAAIKRDLVKKRF